LEATQKDTTITQQYYPNFNLEYNVDFNWVIMLGQHFGDIESLMSPTIAKSKADTWHLNFF